MDNIIAVWGDSIAWGAHDFEKGGRVARLGNHPSLEVYNLGVSGDATIDVIKRFENECSSRKPDVIIFAIGINDSLLRATNQNNVSLEKFQDNINQLYTLAQKFTKKVIFLSLTKVNESKTTPIPWNKKISYYMKYVTAYNNVIKNFCMQNNVFFIDVFDLLTLDDLEDGLHPNTQGHEKIYNKVTDFLLDNKIV